MHKAIKYLISFIFIIAVMVLAIILTYTASTADLPESDLTLPKITLIPDSPFYFLKIWKESIQTFFTFGEENKAKQYLHLAEVRLAEYQKMVEKGKTEIAQKTLEKYEKQLNRALDKVKGFKRENVKDAEIFNRLSKQAEKAVAKHLKILQENLLKVPEQAKDGLNKAIEESQRGIEKILEKKIEKVDETVGSVVESDNLIKEAQSAVENNDSTAFTNLFEENSQTDAQNNFSQMTDEERSQLAQGLGEATLIYQSSDGNLRRYRFTVEINRETTEFLLDLRRDKNGNWRIANI